MFTHRAISRALNAWRIGPETENRIMRTVLAKFPAFLAHYVGPDVAINAHHIVCPARELVIVIGRRKLVLRAGSAGLRGTWLCFRLRVPFPNFFGYFVPYALSLGFLRYLLHFCIPLVPLCHII